MEAKCKFCNTKLSEHEAGRCLDAMVSTYKLQAIRNKNREIRYVDWNKDYCHSIKISGCAGDEFETGTPVPHYSTDLNHAIELKPIDNDWIQFERTMPRTGAEPGDILMNGVNADKEWVITDWDRIEEILNPDRNLDTEEEDVVIAKAPTLALARTRAYLIDQMKEENNDK